MGTTIADIQLMIAPIAMARINADATTTTQRYAGNPMVFSMAPNLSKLEAITASAGKPCRGSGNARCWT